MLNPAWQSLITELVPRNELAAATRLDMVSVNVARAAGPALAGFVIARWGVPPVFALTAVCASLLAVVLLAWRRPRVTHGEREPFLPALVAGGRYVRHEPVVRLILVRLASFMLPACAVWALLPLIANRQLGLDAAGYGLLFAALGIGAVVGALASAGSSSTCRPTGCWGWPRCPSRSPSGLWCWRRARGRAPPAGRLRLRLDRHRVHHHLRAAAVPARLGPRPGDRDLPDGLPRLAGRRRPDLGAGHPAAGTPRGRPGRGRRWWGSARCSGWC